MTNPVDADTNVTDAGSKPLGTAVPAGATGRRVVVLPDTALVAVDPAVVVVAGALDGDEHEAAATATNSTATHVVARRDLFTDAVSPCDGHRA